MEKSMKVAILAGGLGTRLAEETETKPKPMVTVGEHPILWHIMKHYASFGMRDFCVALGYKGAEIKRYFLEYGDLEGSLTLSLKDQRRVIHEQHGEDWNLHLMDTGMDTMTGGRLKRMARLLKDGTFMMTYGDGVGTVDLKALLAFHKAHGKLATVTAVHPLARWGVLQMEGDAVVSFSEKLPSEAGWVNGGFFVLEPEVLEYIDGDSTQFEREPLERLARERQLVAYRHEGFWQCMDTLRDKRFLERLWQEGQAPWKTW